MRIPLGWLRDYVDISLPAEEVAERLTMSGNEVGGIETAAEDSILDIKVTPNRPDCLSVIGIAREVAALSKKRVRLPELSYEEQGLPIEEMVSVEVKEPELCLRYCASLVTEVRVEPSPPWLRERIISAGMRPVNNIVDIANFVMLEYGQPLHAFDYHKLRGGKLIVRRAQDGETLTTLDGVRRALSKRVLVIAGEAEPIALAGVMGGAESEVAGGTTAVLLESANFLGSNIRRTAASLRLKSEASSRFEKVLSAELPPLALRRATQLIVQLGGGKAAKGFIDLYPGKRGREPILLSKQRVGRILGIEVSMEQIIDSLTALGFNCQPQDSSNILVGIPYWRTDIGLADDLVEEVARSIGYDEIPIAMLSGKLPQRQPAPEMELREKVKDILVGCGMQEVITYSLISRDMLEKADPECRFGSPLKVANPLSRGQEYLRTTLRASLLTTLSANEKHYKDGIRLFEIGKVYHPQGDSLPEEREVLAGVLCGPRSEPSWLKGEGMLDFFDAKGIMETLFFRLGVEVCFEPAVDPILLPGMTAKITLGDATLGLVGDLHPKAAQGFDISAQSVSLFEVDLGELLPFTAQALRYHPIPRFPGVVRDIALIVDVELPAKEVLDIIQGFPLVSRVVLFDVYYGEQVPKGRKSLAFSIRYQSPSRTLTDEEVDAAQGELLHRLKQELGATLRG
jgi:phenylalanyl-tRNA synthetase beta chain